MAQGNVVVLGSGLMGSSIALDLLESNSVQKVTVVDTSQERLKALAQRASRVASSGFSSLKNKLETQELDITKNDLLLKIDLKASLHKSLASACLTTLCEIRRKADLCNLSS